MNWAFGVAGWASLIMASPTHSPGSGFWSLRYCGKARFPQFAHVTSMIALEFAAIFLSHISQISRMGAVLAGSSSTCRHLTGGSQWVKLRHPCEAPIRPHSPPGNSWRYHHLGRRTPGMPRIG